MESRYEMWGTADTVMENCPFCTLPGSRIADANRHGLVVRDAFPVAVRARCQRLQAGPMGVSPLRRARLSRGASSHCPAATVSPLAGFHPSRALAAVTRARWRT